MQYREIIAVCSEIHTKHINTAVWPERRICEFYMMRLIKYKLGSEALMRNIRQILSTTNGR